MRRVICPRCGIEFTPEEAFHVLCGEGENNCVGQVDIYGSGAMWRAAAYLVNAKLNVEELESLGDSPPFLKLMADIVALKPAEQFKNLIEQLVKRVEE